MAILPGRKHGRALSRLAVAAVAAALVGTGVGAAAADAPDPVPAPVKNVEVGAAAKAAPKLRAAAQADAPVFGLYGVERSSGFLYEYIPNGVGGYEGRTFAGADWDTIRSATQVDQNGDGLGDGLWAWDYAGKLYYADATTVDEARTIGGGWNIYNKVLSPGNLGGAAASDILARDNAGVLWLYLGYPNGNADPRIKISAGWGGYTQISGKGDLTGDGKADIVAQDSSGVLWLYKGTGNYKAPFTSRVKLGAGWNAYNTLISTGDVDIDGHADLLARGTDGKLWLYKGTGNATTPLASRKLIGSGFNIYSWMF
ncbi:FG-GAP repeat domain-containing protein [Streptomyces sp. CB02923]|uniref:FG-GAP repeat domain-containing protein n=1 Tax=Streptomyces sp. CB02923 TaxID=1718985 RepID=UPI0009A0A9EA|nr:VCBS repeat-containing protein [Streptomyces sp. CB02923]